MLRLAFVALVATTLIGCLPIRQGNEHLYDFAVYVDRAEAPGQSCDVDIGLHNNLDAAYANFEYALVDGAVGAFGALDVVGEGA